MEPWMIDLLRPVLEQWPVVAVILAGSVLLWRDLRHCHSVIEDHLVWFREQFEDGQDVTE